MPPAARVTGVWGGRVSGLLGNLGVLLLACGAGSRRSLVGMDDVSVTELTDEDIERMAPAVRGLVAKRLESLYRECQERLEDAEPGHQDARWAELKLRCLDRQSKLFRLDGRASEPVADEESAVEVARSAQKALVARVAASLDELAAKS